MNPSLFYRAYDALYADKDYRAEVSAVAAAFRAHAGRPPGRVLEVGCGTGNHTRLLCRECESVTAVETDASMADLARQKLGAAGAGNARVFTGLVEDLPESGFDLAAALFHVVTYLGDPAGLASLFAAVFARLAPGGLFFFDCWNGVAALRDPPRESGKRAPWGQNTVQADISPETDLMAQAVTLRYRLRVTGPGGQVLEEGSHEFSQTLWTPREITEALSAAGFAGVSVHPGFDMSRQAGPDDWKVLFRCERP